MILLRFQEDLSLEKPLITGFDFSDTTESKQYNASIWIDARD